jgi:hypothetical protein
VLFAMLLEEMDVIVAIPKYPVYQFERFGFILQARRSNSSDF